MTSAHTAITGLPRSRDLAFGEMSVRCCRGWRGGKDLSSTVLPSRGPQVPNPGRRQQKRKYGRPGERSNHRHQGTFAISPSGLETMPDPQSVSCLLTPLTARDDAAHHVQVQWSRQVVHAGTTNCSGDIVRHNHGHPPPSMPCSQWIRPSSPWSDATARQVPKCRGPTPQGPTASRPGPSNRIPGAKSGTEPSGQCRPRTTEWTQSPGTV